MAGKKRQTKRDKLIAALLKQCEFELECLPEDIQPEDSFDDPKDVAWAKEQLAAGNEWGWCTVRITAEITIAGATFNAVDYLGGCSYENEAAFKHADGYYPSMQYEACALIADKLIAAQRAIESLSKAKR